MPRYDSPGALADAAEAAIAITFGQRPDTPSARPVQSGTTAIPWPWRQLDRVIRAVLARLCPDG
jgi:hypothetical protein